MLMGEGTVLMLGEMSHIVCITFVLMYFKPVLLQQVLTNCKCVYKFGFSSESTLKMSTHSMTLVLNNVNVWIVFLGLLDVGIPA